MLSATEYLCLVFTFDYGFSGGSDIFKKDHLGSALVIIPEGIVYHPILPLTYIRVLCTVEPKAGRSDCFKHFHLRCMFY